MKAESQLRLSVVPPLLAIVVCLALTTTPWWWCGLAPVAILLWQGHSRNADYELLMLAAIRLGVVQSKTVEDFKKWVDQIPELTPQEKAEYDAHLRRVMNEPPDPNLDGPVEPEPKRKWWRWR